MQPEVREPPFTVRRLCPHLLEVTTDAATEITAADVAVLHGIYRRLSEGRPYALLVVKENAYTYSFDAQRAMLPQPKLTAAAFLVSQSSQTPAIQALMRVADPKRMLPWSVFTERAAAMEWLERQSVHQPC